jgi:hypothetical protein
LPDSTNQLPPPLDGEAEVATNNRSSRRLSGFWDILNPGRMQEASPQERVAALRRVQEQGSGSNSSEDPENRRRRRLSTRLGERFGISTRARGVSPNPAIESRAPTSPVTESPHESNAEMTGMSQAPATAGASSTNTDTPVTNNNANTSR